jgi:large subunit ribosomal protein L14e
MAGLEEGTVCIKTRGKEAGRKVVVLEFNKKTGLAIIEGPYVKRRKCNLKHLLPLQKKIPVKKGMKKEELAKLIKQGKD